jgi:hypothetical protein
MLIECGTCELSIHISCVLFTFIMVHTVSLSQWGGCYGLFLWHVCQHTLPRYENIHFKQHTTSIFWSCIYGASLPCIQTIPDAAPLYILPIKAQEQIFPMKFQRESTGKVLPPLATICQCLWQDKCIIKHYNHVQYSAITFCFHQLYRQLPGVFSCTNTVNQQLCITNKTYSGKKTPIVTQGESWAVTWHHWCKWWHSKSRQLQ